MNVSCPGCAGPVRLPARGAPLAECRHCHVLVVRVGEKVLLARAYGEARPASPGVVALVCRLCGAPLPEEALGTSGRCAYCGHTAALPPTVREALGLLVRAPDRAPASFREPALTWLGLAVAALAAIVLLFLRPTPGVNAVFELALPADVSPAGGLALATPDVAVPPRGRAFPYLVASAPELANGTLCVLVALERRATGERRRQWLTMWDGAAPSAGYPARHPYAELSMGRRVAPLPAGAYRVLVEAVRFAPGPGSPRKPERITVELRTMGEPPTGVLVMLLNALVWLAVLDLRLAARHVGRVSRAGRAVRGLALLLVLATLAEIVAPRNPFGARAAFEAAPAPEAPAACR